MVLEGTRGGETMVGRSREEKSGARKEGRGKGGKEKEAVEGGSRPAIRASPLMLPSSSKSVTKLSAMRNLKTTLISTVRARRRKRNIPPTRHELGRFPVRFPDPVRARNLLQESRFLLLLLSPTLALRVTVPPLARGPRL